MRMTKPFRIVAADHTGITVTNLESLRLARGQPASDSQIGPERREARCLRSRSGPDNNRGHAAALVRRLAATPPSASNKGLLDPPFLNSALDVERWAFAADTYPVRRRRVRASAIERKNSPTPQFTWNDLGTQGRVESLVGNVFRQARSSRGSSAGGRSSSGKADCRE